MPAIGVALGGGFARGIAHIGVPKVLEEESIPIRMVAGTSVGAIIGAAYCSGLTIAELEEVAHKVRFTTFARWTISRYGFATNDRMVSFLSRTLKVQTFEELRIPLGVAATDFNTGEGAVFTSGSLIDPVRASCAYPGMFLPVELNQRQEKALLRMLREGPEGFAGGLSAGKYAAITGASPATATRDLVELVSKRALIRTGEHKHTRYQLNMPVRAVDSVVVNERGEVVQR